MTETEDNLPGSPGEPAQDLEQALQDLPLAQHVDRFERIIEDLTEQLRIDN